MSRLLSSPSITRLHPIGFHSKLTYLFRRCILFPVLNTQPLFANCGRISDKYPTLVPLSILHGHTLRCPGHEGYSSVQTGVTGSLATATATTSTTYHQRRVFLEIQRGLLVRIPSPLPISSTIHHSFISLVQLSFADIRSKPHYPSTSPTPTHAPLAAPMQAMANISCADMSVSHLVEYARGICQDCRDSSRCSIFR